MKIKVDQFVKSFDGTELQVGDKERVSLSFRTVIETAINLQSDEHPLTAEKKLQAFQIGVKINAKKLEEYDLTVDQVAFVKERIGLFYSPVVYGRFLELIGDETVRSVIE